MVCRPVFDCSSLGGGGGAHLGLNRNRPSIPWASRRGFYRVGNQARRRRSSRPWQQLCAKFLANARYYSRAAILVQARRPRRPTHRRRRRRPNGHRSTEATRTGC